MLSSNVTLKLQLLTSLSIFFIFLNRSIWSQLCQQSISRYLGRIQNYVIHKKSINWNFQDKHKTYIKKHYFPICDKNYFTFFCNSKEMILHIFKYIFSTEITLSPSIPQQNYKSDNFLDLITYCKTNIICE